MKILYKLTTRSRFSKMVKAIQNIRAMAVEKDPWIIISLDHDDKACPPETTKILNDIPGVTVIYGNSKNKIDAINRDVPKEGWDIIVATSDDIRFLKGMDLHIEIDAIVAGRELNSKDDFTIWYGDGAPHGRIMTVPIMTKKYYDRLGYIYNPIYQSLFCDEESIYVGENLKKIYYSPTEILVHEHPAWGKGEWDPQYKFTDSFYLKDKVIFEQRKLDGFPV